MSAFRIQYGNFDFLWRVDTAWQSGVSCWSQICLTCMNIMFLFIWNSLVTKFNRIQQQVKRSAALILIIKQSILLCFVIPMGFYWWPHIITYFINASIHLIFFSDTNREFFANWSRNFSWLQQWRLPAFQQ